SLDVTSSYVCIDSESAGQILAYYDSNIDFKKVRNKQFKVFGTLGKNKRHRKR
ncbi:MAG: hypothetical protein ACI97N_002175, partial [Cognaticolwellia sp.]